MDSMRLLAVSSHSRLSMRVVLPLLTGVRKVFRPSGAARVHGSTNREAHRQRAQHLSYSPFAILDASLWKFKLLIGDCIFLSYDLPWELKTRWQRGTCKQPCLELFAVAVAKPSGIFPRC